MNASIEFVGQSIKLTGELTFNTVQALQSISEKFALAADSAIAVDFTGVTKVDSASLALCLSIERMLSAHHCTYTYHNVPTAMLAIAGSVGVDDLFS